MNFNHLIPWKHQDQPMPRVSKVHPLWDLHRDMNRVFEDFNRDFFPLFEEGSTQFQPHLDVSEDDKCYALQIEVPGMEPKDINIEIKNKYLTIRGEKTFEKETKDKAWHCRERRFGSFERALEIPPGVVEDDIKADFRNGVLTISLPKSETLQQEIKKIAIAAK